MKNTLAIFAGACLLSSVCSARDYQFEVNGSYLNLKNDLRETNAFTFGGEVYFDKVKAHGLPLKEAAFYRQASSVQLQYMDASSDVSYFGERSSQLDANSYGVGVDLYSAELGLYGGLTYANYSERSKVYPELEREDESLLHARLGLTPMNGLRIHTELEQDKKYDGNILIKYVSSYGDGRGFNVEADFFNGDQQEYSIGGDYYFFRGLGLGGMIGAKKSKHAEDAEDSQQFYAFRSSLFVTEAFFGQLEYQNRELGETFNIGIGSRF